ncbi:MAG: hypothetical protein ACQXXL_03650 [Candidatus Methanosuratincola sp.]|jgi:MoaA/NifB/PqqE/SkfB family radical SAM enzyme|nr:hypothetical protein [Candidatus Methanosuratincola sp.]
MFLVFTNGLLINGEFTEVVRRQRNLVPLLSMEGYRDGTDGRRGSGVYDQLLAVIANLKKQNVFWGASLTVTRANFNIVTDQSFVEGMVKSGCRLFMFVEYTPVKDGTEDWVITQEQRAEMKKIRDALRSRFSAWFVALPGDEEEIGGCLCGQGICARQL